MRAAVGLIVMDKWRQEAAPGKLSSRPPTNRQIQRRRPRTRRRCRRHHPYERARSSTCPGRRRVNNEAKCKCSGVSTGERCNECGARIFVTKMTPLCGLLLARAESQRVISQETDSLLQSDNACPEATGNKRDQGVLAKLPKPKRDEGSKRKKRGSLQTECGFDEMPVVVGPSCTCLTNQCNCAAFNY